MLAKLLIALLLISIVQLALAIGLFMWIGWWALPVLIAINALTGPFLAKRALKALFMMPFRMKGAALAGASATVHAVEAAHAPPPEDEDGAEEEPHGPREYYYVDVTIAPGPSKGGFTYWEPGELVLVRPGAKSIPDDDADEVGILHGLQVWQDGAFVEDEGYKYEGMQRLKLHVGVEPGTREARFRYYFEIFGDVVFPPSTPSVG